MRTPQSESAASAAAHQITNEEAQRIDASAAAATHTQEGSSCDGGRAQRIDASAAAATASISSALERAHQPNYLGNPETLQFLLRNFVSEALHRRADMEKNTASLADMQAALNLADIFLGGDDDYTTLPAWHRPGIIDKFVAETMGYCQRSVKTSHEGSNENQPL